MSKIITRVIGLFLMLITINTPYFLFKCSFVLTYLINLKLHPIVILNLYFIGIVVFILLVFFLLVGFFKGLTMLVTGDINE